MSREVDYPLRGDGMLCLTRPNGSHLVDYHMVKPESFFSIILSRYLLLGLEKDHLVHSYVLQSFTVNASALSGACLNPCQVVFEAALVDCKKIIYSSKNRHVLLVYSGLLRQNSRVIGGVLAHEVGHLSMRHYVSGDAESNHRNEFEADVFATLLTPAEWSLEFDKDDVKPHEAVVTHPSRMQRHELIKAVSAQQRNYQHPFLSTTLSSGQVTLFPEWQPVSLEAFRPAACAVAKAQVARFLAKEPLGDVRQLLAVELAKQGVESARMPLSLEPLPDRGSSTGLD